MRVPYEYLGLIVPDLSAALAEFSDLGHTWSTVTTPRATIRRGENVEVTSLQYVVTREALPRIKLIEEIPGTYWEGGTSPMHHVSYWSDDLEGDTEILTNRGASIEADGLYSDGGLGYRFMILQSGLRVEIGRSENRQEFEAWAEGN